MDGGGGGERRILRALGGGTFEDSSPPLAGAMGGIKNESIESVEFSFSQSYLVQVICNFQCVNVYVKKPQCMHKLRESME